MTEHIGAITRQRIIEAVSAQVPTIVANSLTVPALCDRINTEMVILLSRSDPQRISVRLREEKTINSYEAEDCLKKKKLKTIASVEKDNISVFSNNAIVKIDNEVIVPLLNAFYSSQRLATADALIRFKSGVISSITLKIEIPGY